MAGRWPDIGWLLLDRNSLNQLNLYSNQLQLVISDFVTPPLTITGLSVVQARCVTRGIAADPSAIYLIQVTNNEGILYNPWFQYPVSAQYNVGAPAYDGQFYSGSLNGAVPWTWDAMVGDLWAQAGGLLGAYPHLPIIPSGTPDNFIFVGSSLWEAINRVLDHLGLAISGTNAALTITVCGAADAVYTALATKYGSPLSPSCCLEDSMEYLDVGSGRVPASIVVYFHRRNAVYGTEETVRMDSFQWQNVPSYSVTVPAPSTFSGAAGTGYLWSDYTVRYDMDGNPFASDVATANLIAAERAAQFYDTIYRGTAGFMRDTYGGVLPFTTGSLVDGVRWYNTGMIGDKDDYCGWRTEVVRGFMWEEVTFPLTLEGLTGPD